MYNNSFEMQSLGVGSKDFDVKGSYLSSKEQMNFDADDVSCISTEKTIALKAHGNTVD